MSATVLVVLVDQDGNAVKQQTFDLVDGHLPILEVRQWASAPRLQYHDGSIVSCNPSTGLSHRTFTTDTTVWMKGEVECQLDAFVTSLVFSASKIIWPHSTRLKKGV